MVPNPRRLRACTAALAILATSGLLASCSSSPSGSATTTTRTGSTGSTGSTGTTTTGGGTTTTVGGSTTRALSWHTCDGDFQCATLTVPLSYTDTADGTIGIHVVKRPASGPNPIGDIVINPGGPGASGISYLEGAWSTFPASLRARFALVSFDPRGIGQSAPVNCLTPAQIRAVIALNPSPTTPAQVSQVVTATKGFVADCEGSVPAKLLANVSTAETASDMDRLRAGLGEAKLTYFGYSYGTYLGAVYAQMFPTHVRALVLDGDFPPSLTTIPLEEQQSAGFEQDLHDFLTWCGTSAQCGQISSSGTPEATYERLASRFASGLVISASLPANLGGSQPVNLGVFEIGVISGLYSPSSWPDLGAALAQAENGNGADLALFAASYAGEQSNGTFQNIISANVAISCLDRSVPTGVPTYEHLASQLAATAPDFGPSEAWGGLTCSYWPDPATGKAFRIDAPGLAPVLVIGSTHDPATPYQWAVEMAGQLPGSVLLTRDGDGHTAYGFSSCIRGWADDYLIDLKLPPAGTVCQSDGPGLP